MASAVTWSLIVLTNVHDHGGCSSVCGAPAIALTSTDRLTIKNYGCRVRCGEMWASSSGSIVQPFSSNCRTISRCPGLDLIDEGWEVDTVDLATVTPCITSKTRRFGTWHLGMEPPENEAVGRLRTAA